MTLGEKSFLGFKLENIRVVTEVNGKNVVVLLGGTITPDPLMLLMIVDETGREVVNPELKIVLDKKDSKYKVVRVDGTKETEVSGLTVTSKINGTTLLIYGFDPGLVNTADRTVSVNLGEFNGGAKVM